MEQIQQSIDQMQQNILHLTGAYNAHLEQVRNLESRFAEIESNLNQQQQQEQVPTGIPRTAADLDSIRRLPDCVRDLQVFEGNPTQYVSWIHNVESILKDYEIVRDTPLFGAILKHIRQKIRGPADNALVSYNIFNDSWANIKKCLSLHYADKRDIQSLENQLINMRQGRDSIDQFYNKVNYQLSLIINKIKTDEYNEEGMKVLIENYRHRALDVFIRGLQQNLAHLIKIQKPDNLPEAYTACLELQNMDFRKSMSNNATPTTAPIQYGFSRNNIVTTEYQVPIASRQYHERPHCDNFQHKPFLPVRNQARSFEVRNTVTPSRQFQQNDVAPPRPTQPKPPVPMEVDPSMQTARVNYMNRANAVVRQSNESSNIPKKNQRMFNIETTSECEQDFPATQEERENYEQEYLEQFNEEYQELNFMTGASLEYPS